MQVTMTVLALVVLVDPPDRKEPPTQKDLAAITERGRDLAGYDAAAWHASDAVQAKQPKEGSVVRCIAHQIDNLISPDGTKIESKRQLHKSVIEVEPPKDEFDKQVAGVHTHVLDDTPEDSDVFHALTRKPSVPEMVITKQFVFQVDPEGSIK
jgi:hypothetical protein